MKSTIDFLKQAPQKELLVIGDVMLDEYLFGAVSRVSPEAPVPVVHEERQESYLGGAANTAANCAHIGLRTQLIGIINTQDEAGATVASLLQQSAIGTAGILHSQTRATTRKLRIMAQGQQCLRVDREMQHALSSAETTQVIATIDQLLKPGMTVLVSDYAKGIVTEDVIACLVRNAERYNLTIIADPKGPNFLKYRGIHYMKPNFSEYKQLVNQLGLSLGDGVVANGRQICSLLALRGIFITMGEKGIWYVDTTKEFYAPACKREVYDLSGAGDTVIAFIALALAQGVAIPDALTLANIAASIAISHVKTYAVSLDEVLDEVVEPDTKIMHDWVRLKMRLDSLALRGKKIVFTNGCFDILHVGHVQLLQKAKQLGHVLVVGLNTDASVRRLNKGPERPVNDLADRSAVIAALDSVDFVTSFDQDTPQSIINFLIPQVLVKGGDYKLHQIVGADCVMQAGGEVHVIDLVPGKSTTNMLHRAIQREIRVA